MRVFISSTPAELERYRRAAVEVVRELGHEPVLRDPAGRRGLDAVTACRRQIARADAAVAIIGWRRGPVPDAEAGGDGLQPWSFWEARAAIEHGLPLTAFLAGESAAPETRVQAPEARAAVADLRGELARIACRFDGEAELRRRLRERLRQSERTSRVSEPTPAGVRLRRFAPPGLPPHPYPLLLPYSHPSLMAGRDGDLEDLRRLLARSVTVVGLHAASGTGKSSLLAGGLVPALRAEGRPVGLVRHPAEAGLAGRLMADLVDDEGGGHAGDDPRAFVDRLAAIRRMAGERPPVLVIDQLEDLFQGGVRAARAAAGRAVLGPLLAASAQRLPGTIDPPCRWLLAYRQELHGRLLEWLEDVLRDARAAGREDIGALPHDLSEPSRFVARALRPLATPPPDADDPLEAATRIFLDAIEKPLRIPPLFRVTRSGPPPLEKGELEGDSLTAEPRESDGPPADAGGIPPRSPLFQRGEGDPQVYPWTLAPGHAERLARAFAQARLRRPEAPLVPELQVTLGHLLERAGEPIGGETATVTVPENPTALIDRALEEHLRRALDAAFPRGDARGDDARVARTRALLVLRELADDHGRRDHGRDADVLAQALGKRGREVLERLSTPRTRLVVRERHAGSWVYVLAHDRVAEVLVRAVDAGDFAGLGVDGGLVALRRFVALQSQLQASGDAAQATAVPPRYFARIEAHRDVLLWSEAQRTWWRDCRSRRRLERRRRWGRRALAAAVVMAVALGAWTVAERQARRRALLEEVAAGEPEVAFSALDRLSLERDFDGEEVLKRLRERAEPFDVFEHGLGGVGEARRADALLRLAELALPILDSSPEDPRSIASLVWALDLFGRDWPAARERATALRDRVLGPLRRSRPPPPRPAPGDPHWVDIPAGTFWMGARRDEGSGESLLPSDPRSSLPRHQVTLSAFRIMTHEVTNAEYRRLVPDHDPSAGGDLPATRLNWYQAYTYAAWLGGRLPTEAEWELAARAGCRHAFCRRDGSEATIDEVAWWRDNSTDPRTGEPAAQPVMRLEANPWGLWDVYGNATEWTASWVGPYPGSHQRDPAGPTDSPLDHRALRGGFARHARESVSAALRYVEAPHGESDLYGLRVVLPD